MSDNLEYEIERYLATCLASDDPDAGYMAGNVVEMCREAIAAEIEAHVEEAKKQALYDNEEVTSTARETVTFCADLVRRGEPS